MFKLKVKENEKVLLYKDEKFIKLLDTGVYKMFHLFRNYSIERVRTAGNGIDGDRAVKLHRLYPELVDKYFNVISLEDNERAYISIDGKFTEIMNLGETKLYWRELDITVERVDIREDYRVSETHINYLDMFSSSVSGVKKCAVGPYQESYLYHNEVFVDKLSSGRYYFYTDLASVSVHTIDSRIKELEINGQELLSADKVTLRCNITMHYKIADGMTYLTKVDNANEYLHKQLQFAVRKHLGAMDIDTILSMQHTLSDEVLEKLSDVCEAIGVDIESVHIKDIILPGEMREIFNQVIEASKRAEANNIARREETAATRSLLNTAKLMKDNPSLARLKELEALEKITQTVGTLNVYGGLDNVMHGLVDLKGA